MWQFLGKTLVISLILPIGKYDTKYQIVLHSCQFGWRIRSVPGNKDFPVNISAIMHPTDQISTDKSKQLINRTFEKLHHKEVNFFLFSLYDLNKCRGYTTDLFEYSASSWGRFLELGTTWWPHNRSWNHRCAGPGQSPGSIGNRTPVHVAQSSQT